MAISQEEREIIRIIREKRRKSAQPWRPATDEFLLLKEFAVLAGISVNKRSLKMLTRVLIAAQNGSDICYSTVNIKDYFRDGNVRVYCYQGKGNVITEYRIATIDLAEKHLGRAQTIILARKHGIGKHISPFVLKQLEFLSSRTNTDIMELLRKIICEQFNSVPLSEMFQFLAKRDNTTVSEYIDMAIEAKWKKFL